MLVIYERLVVYTVWSTNVAVTQFGSFSSFARYFTPLHSALSLRASKPDKGSSSVVTTDWVTYAVAFAAACIGSILTIAGELFLRGRTEKVAFKEARRQLLLEVKTIFHECERRASSPSKTFVLEAPLPRSTWTTLVLSGQLRRLKTSQIEQLNDFYREVESINARAALVPMLLQTVALSRQAEVQSAFSEEAERVSREPYSQMITRRAALERSLGEGLQ